MTYEMLVNLMAVLEGCGDCYSVMLEDEWHITVDDFVGFDKEWNEVFRTFVHPELVKYFVSEVHRLGDGGFVQRFTLDGHPIAVDFSSHDI